MCQIRHANGIASEYRYDELNRLEDLTHYAPDATPGDLYDNAVLQRYEYTYHADGNKSGERFTDGSSNVQTWAWLYDALGRLTREIHDNTDDSLDYSTESDLVGNRLWKNTVKNGDGIADERIESEFDRNDRLLNEWKILGNERVSRTEYLYQQTEQYAKRVYDLLSGHTDSKTDMKYNDQGRLSELTVTTYENGVAVKIVTQTIRVRLVWDQGKADGNGGRGRRRRSRRDEGHGVTERQAQLHGLLSGYGGSGDRLC